VLAQRAKDKVKKKGGFFGFGGKTVTKEEEEVDAEQDHDDREEVSPSCGGFIEVLCCWCTVCLCLGTFCY